ncbi:hypothetical protein OG217_15795 [Streptomyces sp. NBC_01023]|uniref:hypothetical protein n=1 Tax=Streptomyces sp. NBC_01023 TaxID=2903724 RepID=UPI00386A76B1|nr:hypothetical protein OG217_15795 [Streptomyces sp. NBC_01023]
MNRRSLPAAAAIATAAALLLTACSGGGDSKSKDSGKIAGADQGASKPASPSASSSAAPDRPKFTFPADVSYVFDWPKAGDPDRDAVLADGEQFIKAEDYAIVKQDPKEAGYRFYTEGQLAASTQEYIASYVKVKARITGTDRYYNATVDLSGKKTATLSYCEDQRKTFDLYLKTNKVDRTPLKNPKDNYVLYNTALSKNDQGVWVTTKLFSERGSNKCQP